MLVTNFEMRLVVDMMKTKMCLIVELICAVAAPICLNLAMS